ncbi:MAG TPA: ATP-binding protein [Chthonomonadales bacterium]|nr:ATP-binding protein [Chthonomonadales bacterium]
MRRSLRARVTSGFAVMLTCVLTVMGVAIFKHERLAARRQATQALSRESRRLGEEVTEDGKVTLSAITDQAGDLASDGMTLLVLDSSGRILFKPKRSAIKWPAPGPGWMATSRRFGSLTAVICYPWFRAERSLRGVAEILALLSTGALLASVLGAWVLVGRTLSPIGELSSAADAASIDNLRVRLTAPSEDEEIVRLVTTLNGLLLRLSEAAAARARFYSAASHELRTPLQSLAGHLELALTRDRDAEAYRKVIEEANLQTARLSALIQSLLVLGRLDSGIPATTEPADIVQICDEAMLANRSLALARNLQFRVDFPESAPTRAIPTHLDMLMRNLIENTCRYALEGTEVLIALKQSCDETRLILFNRCHRISAEDEARLFEPFYRPDDARSLESGGSGLGLAICKAIAAANGWSIAAMQRDGMEVTVTFRTAGPSGLGAARVPAPEAAPTGADTASPGMASTAV